MLQIVEAPWTPVLDTDRLRLRAHQVRDFEACVAMWSDPATTRYTTGDPASPQRTWQRILAYRGHWELLRYGYWALEEKASGRYIGELGFADFKRDNQPDGAGLPEAGWALRSEYQGKGGERLLHGSARSSRRLGRSASRVARHRLHHSP